MEKLLLYEISSDSAVEETTMIFGAHVVVYSKDAEADRAFFRDVLGFAAVDAGHGWLIFALPPAEAAILRLSTTIDTNYISCAPISRPKSLPLRKRASSVRMSMKHGGVPW